MEEEEKLVPLKPLYQRTSTPIPSRKRAFDIRESLSAYEKFSEKLYTPPSKFKVHGASVSPRGVIAGHLINYSTEEKTLEPILVKMENINKITRFAEIEVNKKKGVKNIQKDIKSFFMACFCKKIAYIFKNR